MPRFQNYNPPGEMGGARFGGTGLGQPGIVPPPDPVQTGGVGGGTINFTAGGPTLQALRERQKRLQQAAPELPPPSGMTSPWQGASYLANTLVNSLQQNAAAAQEEKGQQEFANAMSTGIDWNTGEMKPEAMSVLMARDPEVGMQFIGEMIKNRREAASQEHWVDIPAPEGADPGQQWQQNTITGEKVAKGGKSGTNVTINPPSAETSAKLGLAQGFIDNYDAIVKSANAGEMTGTGYITSVTLGRGNGGAQYRNLLQGTEALVRLLTGAGMNESEARQRVTQFEPSITDDAPTLVSKITGLKQAIDNVKVGVETRGKTSSDQATPDVAPPTDVLPAPTDPKGYEIGKSYTFDDGSWGTYKGPGPVNDPSNWEVHENPAGGK